ncbi:hypothetical protein CKA38_03435 [Ereboglobus luteus]|uniref:Uncharacterized protein n=1 Tax=Ereboglobus luteus TaxID=1796921 RepID=A0A2U8E0R0_9BACT|nr:hypothetical protein CKA38_03435 [Ereboglobus luteus]
MNPQGLPNSADDVSDLMQILFAKLEERKAAGDELPKINPVALARNSNRGATAQKISKMTAQLDKFINRVWHQRIYDMLFNREKKRRIIRRTVDCLCELAAENSTLIEALAGAVETQQRECADALAKQKRQIEELRTELEKCRRA